MKVTFKYLAEFQRLAKDLKKKYYRKNTGTGTCLMRGGLTVIVLMFIRSIGAQASIVRS